MNAHQISRRKFALAAAGGAALLTLQACGRRRGASGLVPVSVGISPFQDTLLPIFGVEKGWYAEAGLDPTFRILGWTEVQEALSSSATNRIDVGINNISSVVATYHRNPDLCYLYGFNTFDNGFALLGRPNGRVRPLSAFLQPGVPREEAVRQTAAQLRGRTVVTTSNTDMEQGVAAAARRGGLDFRRDVRIVNLPPDEGLAAFLSGTGDAYIGGVPQRTRGVREGLVEVLTGVDIGPAPINGYVGTKRFWEDSPDTVVKLVQVWFRIVTYINENLDEGARAIVDVLNRNAASGFTVDDFKSAWNNVEHYMASAEEVERNILSESGPNYWRRRWDDCNLYFHDVLRSIPEPVNPSDAFYMSAVHAGIRGV